MRLTVFQSAEGDCLLVESADGARMLVDGGMAGTYRTHVAPTLEQFEQLEVVCVSHIDEDHISGVLALMDDMLKWRVHEIHVKAGDTKHRAPRVPRPPKVLDMWHNAFTEQLDEDTGPIADLLAASAARLDFGTEDGDGKRAAHHRKLAYSVPQAIRLSNRVREDQLNIPLNNGLGGGRLALIRDVEQTFDLGSVKLTLIGPFAADLDRLRDEWKTWLRENAPDLAELQRKMRDDVALLGNGEVRLFRSAIEQQAKDLGDRKKVTAPNLASLMLLAKEGDKTVLLTGDGHADDILKGLEHAGLAAGAPMHVNVLKVQHHGSEFNVTKPFCERVTADDYVFCGNGSHENPDLDVLELILASRTDNAFKLWFNSSAKVVKSDGPRTHMQAVEELVRAHARQRGFEFAFLEDSFFVLDL